MRTYLLDTDMLGHLARRKVETELLERLAVVPAGRLCTTTINVYEIRLGCNRQARRGERLWERFHNDVLSRFRIIPFEERHALRAGDLVAQLLETGQTIGVEDSLVAAIALEEDACLVTTHVRHFAKVPGLEVENWLA